MGGMTGGIRGAQIARNPFVQRILRKATGGMRDFCAACCIVACCNVAIRSIIVGKEELIVNSIYHNVSIVSDYLPPWGGGGCLLQHCNMQHCNKP